MTAPYLPEAEQALRQPIRHVVEAQLTHPSFSAPVPLSIISGTIEYRTRTSPYVEAGIQVQFPTTLADIERFDPRIRPVVEIDAGYVYASGLRDVHPVASLDLYDAVLRRPSNTLDLRAVSREIRLQDAMTTTARSYTSASDAGAAIRETIAAHDTGFIAVDIGSASFVTGADVVANAKGDNPWDFIESVAERVGARVYHDGLGTWRVTQPSELSGTTTHFLATGPTGQIRGSESARSRLDWYNSIAVEFQWYDGEQRTATGYAEVSGGPFSVATVGRKHIKQVRNFTGSTAEAQASAKTLLVRGSTRGRMLSIESAAAAWWLRPGDTVQVQLPTGQPERHLVEDVSFDFPTGAMNVKTRQPINETITTGA